MTFFKDDWEPYTNAKALVDNSVRSHKKYSTFRKSYTRYIEKKIDIYMLKFVLPSPQMELKIKSQAHDLVYHNKFVHNQLVTQS